MDLPNNGGHLDRKKRSDVSFFSISKDDKPNFYMVVHIDTKNKLQPLQLSPTKSHLFDHNNTPITCKITTNQMLLIHK